MLVVRYDPATCPHEWVLPGVMMPQGYWKPIGPLTCRWCGVWQAAGSTTSIIANEEDLVNWDAGVDFEPARPSGTIEVTLRYAERDVPFLFDARPRRDD